MRAVHFNELRDRINELRALAGSSAGSFSGGTIVSGTRKIKASDLTDLRAWLVEYENSAYGQTKRARTYVEYDAYDGTTQFGKGKRTALWDACGGHGFRYDKAGRLASQWYTLDGRTYTTLWTYDANDRPYQMTYPDGEVLTYTYGANALLAGISSSLGALVSGAQYNAFNQIKQYTLGGTPSALAWFAYYGPDYAAPPYGAIGSLRLQRSGYPLLVGLDLGYDFVGNVTSIDDLANGENIGYNYDHLDRLLTAGSPLNESYSYNEIGNITYKNPPAYTYDPNHKHAVASYNGVNYYYDANGCMTTRGNQTIKYDPESRPVRVDAPGTICRFSYDGDGVRRKRLDANGTIYYVGPYERNVGNGQSTAEVITKYYLASFGNMTRVIAFRKNGTLYWVGTDHLGGTIRVADASFNPVDQMRYRPWGESRDPGTNLNTDHLFTAQIKDASIGLYWYASRAYDPSLSRFVAPDTIVPSAANPQALNRYSYGLNNPLKYVDKDGHIAWFAVIAIGAVAGAIVNGTAAAMKPGAWDHPEQIALATGQGAVAGGLGAALGLGAAVAAAGVGLTAAGALVAGAVNGAVSRASLNVMEQEGEWAEGVVAAGLLGGALGQLASWAAEMDLAAAGATGKPYLVQEGIDEFFLGARPTLEEVAQASSELYQDVGAMLAAVVAGEWDPFAATDQPSTDDSQQDLQWESWW